MEVNMSSPVPEISKMENDGGHVGAVKLTKTQIKNRKRALKKKLKKNLESLDKREDTENAKCSVTTWSSHFSNKPEVHFNNISVSSLPGKSNSGLDTTEIVNQKTTVSTVAATGDEKISNTGTENGKGNGAAKLTKSQRMKMRKLAEKESIAMTGGQTENKKVNTRPIMREILDPVYLQKLEAANGEGSGTTATDKPASKKRAQKNVNKNPALGCVETHDKVIADKGSGAGKVFEATAGEMVPPGVTMVPKGDLHTEVGNGNTASDNPASKKRKRQKNEHTKSAPGDIMKTCEKVIEEKGLRTPKSIEAIRSEMVTGKNAIPEAAMASKLEEHAEVVNGKFRTDNPTSKKKRKRGNKKKNPALGEITIICDNTQERVIAENSLGINKSIGAISSEMVTGKNAILDLSMVLKVEEHTEVANGKTEIVDQKTTVSTVAATGDEKISNTGTENGKVNGAAKLTKSQRRKMRKLAEKESIAMTGGQNENKKVNTRPIMGEILDPVYLQKLEAANGEGSGTTATDKPASKKRAQKNVNKNPALGCVETHDKVIAEKGSGAGKVFEATAGEMVPPGVTMVPKGDLHTEVGNGKNAITGASMVSKVEEHTEVASGKTGTGTDTTTSKKRKRQRQKLKKKGLASDGILSIGESAQDTVIVNEVLGTNKPLEALSTESKREDFPELFGDVKGPKTITGDAESTILKTIGCTKVINSDIGSTGTTTTAQNSPLPKKTLRQRKKQKSVVLNTINNTEVKQITQVATLGKKLVIFDLNGLLADVVYNRPKDVKADAVIRRRAIYKRPFLDDFLRFCFERFNIGIWSSRTKPVLDPMVDFLLGELKNKLLFIWDASHCTNSGLRTLEDRHKPVVFKDLRNIWEKKDPENRWVKGTFNESNTLLLDDSPYKALLNPKHSGIFPASYTYKNKDDDFLGPKGEFRTYLEGLAAADNVKSYVEQHPFGQIAIDEKNPHWSYYSRALKSQNR